jgi:hypothetical protein
MTPDAQRFTLTARLTWFAMLVATGVYFMALTVIVGSAPQAAPDVTTLRYVLMAAAGVDIGAIYVFRRRLPLDALAGKPVPAPAEVFGSYVVCWALSESVGLFGLVLGIVGRSVAEAQPFLVVAAALLIWQRPRPAHFGA